MAAALHWILCDLGKTLVDFDHRTVATGLGDLFSREPQRVRGTRPSAEVLHSFLFSDPVSGAGTRNALMDSGARDIVWLAEEIRRAFDVGVSAEELLPIWQDIFTEPHEDVFETMRRARSAGIRVGICSNTNPPHWEHIRRRFPQVDHIHDGRFLSFEMRMTKGMAGFFPRILDLTREEPDRHVLLDDLEENVEAARRAGIRAIHYERGGAGLEELAALIASAT